MEKASKSYSLDGSDLFLVTEIINSNAVKINSDKLGHKFHPVINVERLKPYHSGMDMKQLDDE